MIRALIFSRDPNWIGGVTNFVETLKSNFSSDIMPTHFQMGQRINDKGEIRRFFITLFDNIRLVKTLKNQNYDLVHLNPSLNAKALLRDGLFLITLHAMGFSRTIVFFHGWDTETEHTIRNNPFLRFIFKLVFSKASIILLLASRFKDSLTRMGFRQSKIQVVSTMFDKRNFEGIKRKSDRNEKTILFLGRFIRKKGLFELLEGFEKITKRFPETKLILVGDGSEREKMKKWVMNHKISECVRFPGYLRGVKKVQLLKDSDIFVLPSYSEGCPVALLEAMAAGLAVVTSPVGGIPDIFSDGKNGILLNSVTPDNIATAIIRLLRDEAFSNKVGEHNRRIAWENYEACIVTKKMEAIYRSLANSGQNS